MIDVEELKRLVGEVSNGPWEITRDQSGGYDIWGKDQWGVTCLIGHIEADGDKETLDAANAALIVAAVNALPGLLAENERLREALTPFALVAEHDIGSDETDRDIFRPMLAHNHAPRLSVGDLRRARAALGDTP